MSKMDQETQNTESTEQMNLTGIGLTILVIVILAFFIDIGSLRVWVEKVGIWGPIVFILLKISTVVIAPLSGSPLYPLAGQGSDNYCRNFKKNKYYWSPYTNFLNPNPKRTYINEKGEDYYHEYGESDAG